MNRRQQMLNVIDVDNVWLGKNVVWGALPDRGGRWVTIQSIITGSLYHQGDISSKCKTTPTNNLS